MEDEFNQRPSGPGWWWVEAQDLPMPICIQEQEGKLFAFVPRALANPADWWIPLEDVKEKWLGRCIFYSEPELRELLLDPPATEKTMDSRLRAYHTLRGKEFSHEDSLRGAKQIINTH